MHGHDEPDPGKRQPQVEPSQEPSVPVLLDCKQHTLHSEEPLGLAMSFFEARLLVDVLLALLV